MKAWWATLAERDRRMLVGGGLVVAAMLFWALWFDPLLQSRRSLADGVRQAEADLVYMQAASQQLAALQSGGSASDFDRGGRSLLALADASAREAQLANALKRVEPVSSGRVSVWLEAASFDAMATWLEQMQARFGVRVEEFSLARVATPGQVDARVVLVDPAP
jgi:general secretion pathway protein M